MKFWSLLAAVIWLTSCSDTPVAKTPEKPPEPLTGRQAFYQTYGPARAWAIDAQPLRVRSLDLAELPADHGKSAAWEATYVSVTKGRSRIFTWSAIEASGNLHKGVFASQDESWRAGPSEKPFLIQALKTDTPDVLQTAITHSETYFKNLGPKPHPRFVLEYTSRYPDPVWRVYWGESVSTAEWNVFIDATTGEYSGR
jgi:hypothetical protein